MDEKTRLLISVGAATASNCIPCFEYLYTKVREEGIGLEEIQEAVAIAEKIKNRSTVAIKTVINDILDGTIPLTGDEPCPCSCST
jgi:hypothetical protein